jgi:hypothetical protein
MLKQRAREILFVFTGIFFILTRLHQIYLTIQVWGSALIVFGLFNRTPRPRFSFNLPSIRWDWPWVGYVLLILVGIQILAALGTLWFPEMLFAEKNYYASGIGTRYNTITSSSRRSGWKKNLYASLHLVFGVASALCVLGMVTVQ